jgi:predicted permease
MTLDTIARDLRFEARQLRRSPGFALTAVFTLALGLCASLTIFAFVDAALVKPLPYRQPASLVGVYERVDVFARSNLSYLDYLDWKRLNTVFSTLSAYQSSGMALTTASGAERVPTARVSDDFFRTLGVSPVVGRDFRAGEDRPEAPRVAILTYSAWQTRYAGRPETIGASVVLNGDPHVIVGVLPRGFHFAPVEPAEFWTTLHASHGCDARRSCHNMFGVARLRDGVSLSAAAANAATIARQLEQQYPDSNRGQRSAIVPLSEVIVGDVRPVLIVLLAGSVLLLVIALVNVAGLLLVRAEARRKEIEIRTALGASGARVVAQFVVEAILLVGASVATAIAAAYWASRGLLALIPANVIARMPYLREFGTNGRVAAFAFVVAGIAIAVLASAPVMQLSLTRGRRVLSDRGSSAATWRHIGSKLVVVEIVTAMILLVGGGLLGKSLYRVLHVDIGFDPTHLSLLNISLPDAAYGKDAQQVGAAEEILRRVAALPGVQSASVTGRLPLQPGNTVWIRIEGRPDTGEHNEVHYREIGVGYFTTLKARLARGRDFTPHDDATRNRVVIINETLARQYFPGQDPLGRRMHYYSTTSPPMEIIGVVGDVKEGLLDAATPPSMYVPLAQEPTSGLAIVVRTAQEEESVLPALAAVVHGFDPSIPTFAPRTMNQVVLQSQPAYLRRSTAALVAAFAALAWLLGIVGLYGTIAYSVSQRTREIAIRMALGAARPAVRRLIVGEAAMLTGLGLAIGAACALAAATSLRGLLFGVSSWDLPTLATAAAALATSAIIASDFPARRASRVDAQEALRTE